MMVDKKRICEYFNGYLYCIEMLCGKVVGYILMFFL